MINDNKNLHSHAKLGIDRRSEPLADHLTEAMQVQNDLDAAQRPFRVALCTAFQLLISSIFYIKIV
jgi:hypothetical protein